MTRRQGIVSALLAVLTLMLAACGDTHQVGVMMSAPALTPLPVMVIVPTEIPPTPTATPTTAAPPRPTPVPIAIPLPDLGAQEDHEAITPANADQVVELRAMGESSQAISGAAFGLNGALVIAARSDGAVQLWETESGSEARLLAPPENTENIYQLQSPLGNRSLWAWQTGGRGGVIVEGDALDSATLYFSLSDFRQAARNAWTPDRRMVARHSGGFSNGHRGDIEILEAGEESRILPGNDDALMGLAFNQDGSLLVSIGSDRVLRLWNVESGETVWTTDSYTGRPTQLGFSADGTLFFCLGHAGDVFLWNITAREEIASLSPASPIQYAGFSPDGTVLATGHEDGSISLWDSRTGEVVARLEGHTGGVNALAFNREGSLIASAGQDGTVRLWGIP